MQISPLGIIPSLPLHKLNWFEGFRRIKSFLSVVFVLGALSFSCIRFFDERCEISTARGGEVGFKVQEMGSWPQETAKSGDVLAKRKGDIDIFPEGSSIFKIYKGQFIVLRDLLLSLVAWFVFIELCFWIPVYIARGFGTAK